MNKLIDRISAIFTDEVKTPRGIVQIYKGDPVLIPNVNMPAITINPQTTRTVPVDSCHDQKIQQISIILILDARKFFNTSQNETGLFVLSSVMEEEDTNGRLKGDTILGALRENLYPDRNFVLKIEDENISYGFASDREFPTIEAELTFTAYGKLYQRII
jgi:hypothetical protein